MSSSWFAPKWQHRDPGIRATAVARSDDQALLGELGRIAAGDEDAGVRAAALQRCRDPEVLWSCYMNDADAGNRRLAAEQLCRYSCRLPADSAAAAPVSDLLPEFVRALQQAGREETGWSTALIESLACEAGSAEVRACALPGVTRQGLLGDRVLKETEPGLRRQALERITRASTLNRIGKKLRKTDKQLYHICQQRLQQLQPHTPEAATLQQQRAEELVNRLEGLLHGKRPGDLEAALQTLQRDWQSCATGNAVLQRRWDAAMKILQRAASAVQSAPVQDVENSSGDSAANAAESNPATDTAAPPPDSEAADELRRLAAELEALLDRDWHKLEAFRQQLDPWRRRWRQAWQQLARIGRTDQQLQDEINNRIRVVEQRLAQQSEDRQQQQHRIGEQLDEAIQLADDGKLQKACELEQRLQAELAALPTRQRRRYDRQWRRLHSRLGQLRKWQRWSDNQQRRRLLKELRTARTSDLTADAKLSLVKDARETWQQLEESEKKTGMRPLGGEHSLNRQFNGVCSALVREARPFLQKRSRLREERSRLIRQTVQQIHHQMDGENPGSKALLQSKRRLGRMFRELNGAPARERKALAKALRSCQNELQQRLDASFDQAENEKRRLIRLAEQLGHQQDRKLAIDEARKLQQQWQRIDILPRKREQELWEAFRAPIQPLFEALDRQREQHQAEQQERLRHQEEIVAAVEQLLQADDAELPDLQNRYQDLQEQWRSQSRPEPKLQQRFRKAADTIEKRLRAVRQQQQRRRRKEQDELAHRRQQQVSDSLANGDASLLPEDLRELDENRLQSYLQEQSKRGRLACIAAEFMAGLPSPKEDQQQRMQYQVERLSQHLRDREKQSPQRQLRELRENWYASVPMDPEQYPLLQNRFQKAMEAAEKLLG